MKRQILATLAILAGTLIECQPPAEAGVLNKVKIVGAGIGKAFKYSFVGIGGGIALAVYEASSDWQRDKIADALKKPKSIGLVAPAK